MSRYFSKDARTVVNHLANIGVEVESKEDGYALEWACVQFFPNHIMGVIDKIMKGGRVAEKLAKAQDQGWGYFNKPVHSMLGGRTAAWKDADLPEEFNPEWGLKVYGMVTSGMLLSDMTNDEAKLLIVTIPTLTTDPNEIIGAVRVCKQRQSRSVYYLNGILSRTDQQKKGRIKEVKREAEEMNKPFQPPEDFQPLDPDTIGDFDSKMRDAELIHHLREYEKTQGR